MSTGFFATNLAEADPQVAAAVHSELGRQQDQIELIASENIVSRAVLEAQGSVLTNKYAEGYPGRRYYGGWRLARGLLARAHPNVVVVALANELARIAWAVLHTGQAFQAGMRTEPGS